MFSKVLIANRGAIACRIIRTLRRLGVAPVAVYSDADRHAAHVAQADAAVRLGPPPAAESYLRQDAIIEAALRTGAQAIHPGYGFLSENAGFVEACERAGLVFLGPTPAQMRALGLKHTAREIAEREGAPLLTGTGLLIDETHALDEAERCGYPVILKSTAGGGGIGMRVCRTATELTQHFAAVARMGAANFGQGGVYLERFVERARHIEVQVFGDGAGNVISLGERDCSAQRRNQKVVEETPAPGLKDDVRRRLWDTAETLARAVKYRSAGTVEFLYDSDRQDFFFLEVNTRLQVEHGVTEEVTGVDIVEWMLRLGAGTLPPIETLRVAPSGASIQVRVYAEDAAHDFRPSTGLLTDVRLPPGVRCDTWVERGTEVTPYYDPMLAKIIVRGESRAEAMARLETALAEASFAGLETNLDYLRQIIVEPEFRDGGFPTSFLSRVHYQPRAFEVLDPGMQTTVQDYPGRTGFWHVGVPPSGPMDALAFRLVNRLVGNDETAAGLECTMTGPRLRFFSPAVIALGGADMKARLDGAPVERWRAIAVKAGSELRLGAAAGAGARAYIAVRGGLDVPAYLGSRATFILGRFGGHAGRVLRMGDMLRWHDAGAMPLVAAGLQTGLTHALPEALTPAYSHEWEIGVLYGPHGSPDFFTDGDIATLFGASWKVHYNSDRTGVRLIGPRPAWARRDGGEAGLHPSNLHDNAYAVGAMDFTGDMPILLGPDGPSLGGFVCPAVIAQAELWKLGQLRAGDTVRFRRITNAQATRMERELDAAVATLDGALPHPQEERPDPAVLLRGASTVHRAAGDRYLLVETGPNELSLDLRVRIHALEQLLRERRLKGIVDVTPGIRSLQIHYDSRVLPREELMAALEDCERALPGLDDITIPSRVVHLPLSWEDPATLLAIEKYMQSVRADAPWCPSNTEFIRRINGLDTIEDVRQIVYGANYQVLGLGDVYLGAPVATPVDPRHRLVTTKYNPARTWTAENSVGIGGAYLCVYGMEGPGGYQFVGRTVQMWNTHRATPAFEPGTPWLLRFFDQIKFFPVSAAELLEMRDAFPHGKYDVAIEPLNFSMREYRAFLASIAPEARAAKQRQQAAFEAERERWAAAGQPAFVEPPDDLPPPPAGDVPEGCEAVRSPMTASVWHVAVEPGQRVEVGQRILVLEAMKMEVEITAHTEGVVELLHCAKGAMVTAGQNLATVRVDAEPLLEHKAAAIERIFDAIEAEGLHPIWIALADRDAAIQRARAVDPALPLAGVPFAVKDNIDVAGMPTTAGCPAYSYVPERTATVVQRLLDAGAILIGKTNLDQFATGLVGVRSPFGACSSVFDARYISGGSSSGSAVAVAKGLVAFALGTDTAGSGRVPAAFNDIVGLKPTRGLLSTAGVVPACRSLDCVSIFAGSAAGADRVWRVAQGFDAADPFSRTAEPGAGAAPWLPGAFRFGVPRDEELEFFGDSESPRLYRTAVARLEAAGGTRVTIDFTPFREAAALLYSGPWVAERYAAVGEFVSSHVDDVHPVVGSIIRLAASKTAADAYRGLYRLEELKRAAAMQWAGIDVMLLPTAGTIYTKEAVEADPLQLNTNLGYYTNFVNLMDLAAVAVPAGFRRDGLPFGVSLVGPAFSDAALLALASRFAGTPRSTRSRGPSGPPLEAIEAPGCIHVAVVGAHLTGQPLNKQLTERGARLVQSCRTSPEYRFYALANTTPPKPGLVREPGFEGPGIALEIWAVPSHHFGSFVAGVPAPLGIGSVQLDTGEWVKGFICEPAALVGATEITSFGGWTSYLASARTNVAAGL